MLWLSIDYHSEEPVYRQIVTIIQEAIMSGKLKANEPLPSIREMARSQRINPNTVARAYRELENLGLIYSRPGVGSFIRAKSSDEIEEQVISLLSTNLEEIVASAKRCGVPEEDLKDILLSVVGKVYGGDKNASN